MKKGVILFWASLTIVYLVLAVCHFYASNGKIALFLKSDRPSANTGTIKVFGSDLDQPL
ncbi:hypothetical protein OMAG_002564, partial [Candidatus Omnitrophus magneticus]